MNQITLRSDRDTDYNFTYKGEERVLAAGTVLSIAGGLADLILPTCVMKIISNVIVIKEDVVKK